MEKAGADAIELNIYSLVTDPSRNAAEVEKDYCALVRKLRENLRIPIAVKLSHFFSAIANFASHIDTSGANALVLFNRFYQPDLDINQMEVVPSLTLSHPSELLLRLHWTAVIYGHISADIAVTGGVHRAEDVLKSVMAGAHVAMMTSALLQMAWRTSIPCCPGRPMDGGARIRVHQPNARKHEPAERAGPRDVRAGQLHARNKFLYAALSSPIRRSVLSAKRFPCALRGLLKIFSVSPMDVAKERG